MELFFSIILFFVYTLGLGYSLTFYLKQSSNIFERIISRIGIGLGSLITIAFILDFFKIPLDWRLFLVLSLIIPVFKLIKNKKININKENLSLNKNLYFYLAIILFIITAYMYISGAFAYPFLEDDDSWSVAVSTRYIADEKNFSPPEFTNVAYIDPYPPGYMFVMGLLAQTTNSIYFTLKFFNAFIISLGILFFFIFAKQFIGSSKKAFYSTFVLFAIPCYLSHFIWGHAFIPTLFFIAMYALEQIGKDKKWAIPAAIMIATFPFISPTQMIKVGIMLSIYVIVKFIAKRKIIFPYVYAALGALLLSLLWWSKSFGKLLLEAKEGAAEKGKLLLGSNTGTGSRSYNFADFFVASSNNSINNPVGIGIMISLILVLTLVLIFIYKKKLLARDNYWLSVSLLWLIFTFIGINTMTFHLPVGLFAFRFWMLFAIPVALLAGEGITSIISLLKSTGIKSIISITVIFLLVILTSFVPKYQLNTNDKWHAGSFWSMSQNPVIENNNIWIQKSPELYGYTQLFNLPYDTKIFTYGNFAIVIGFDKFTCFYCKDDAEYRLNNYNDSAQETYDWLKSKDYEYVVIDAFTAQWRGPEITQQKIDNMTSSGLFTPEINTGGMLLFKLN